MKNITKQKGAVLLLSLVLLIVVTSLGISTASRFQTQAAMVGAIEDRGIAEEAALSAMKYAKYWLNQKRIGLPSECTTIPCTNVWQNGNAQVQNLATKSASWWTSTATRAPAGFTIVGQPRFVIERMPETNGPTVDYKITARGVGRNASNTIILTETSHHLLAEINLQADDYFLANYQGLLTANATGWQTLDTVKYMNVMPNETISFTITNKSSTNLTNPLGMLGWIKWNDHTYPTHSGYFTNVSGYVPKNLNAPEGNGWASDISSLQPAQSHWIAGHREMHAGQGAVSWNTVWTATHKHIYKIPTYSGSPYVLWRQLLPGYWVGPQNQDNPLYCMDDLLGKDQATNPGYSADGICHSAVGGGNNNWTWAPYYDVKFDTWKYRFHKLRIYNRKTCCDTRLFPLRVRTYDHSWAQKETKLIQYNAAIHGGGKDYDIMLSDYYWVGIVRLQPEAWTWFHIEEMEAYFIKLPENAFSGW